jgi:mono/diheme cytochrome c family protein
MPTRASAVAPVAAAATLIAVLASGCGAVGRTTEGQVSQGEQLFTEKCASCHTLSAAGAQGRVGPNLDEAFDDVVAEGFEASTVRDVVRGQISYAVTDPPVRGVPGMPDQDELFPPCEEGESPEEDDCFADSDAAADSVAAYVAAAVYGATGGGQAGGGGAGGATDGESIFASAGCGTCHTLAAAGSTGTIGPDLDEAQPDEALAVERVTTGRGAMPAFEDRLSDEQIRAVARYVAENAGK